MRAFVRSVTRFSKSRLPVFPHPPATDPLRPLPAITAKDAESPPIQRGCTAGFKGGQVTREIVNLKCLHQIDSKTRYYLKKFKLKD